MGREVTGATADWSDLPLGHYAEEHGRDKAKVEQPEKSEWDRMVEVFNNIYDDIIDHRQNVPDPMMIRREVLGEMIKRGIQISPEQRRELLGLK